MRSVISLILAIFAMSESAVAQREPALPSEMVALEAKLQTRVGPETRTWIRQEADREGVSNTISEATAVRAGRSLADGWATADVEALAFLVLMQAAKSAQEDLKAIMASVKAINNAKASFVQSAGRSTVRSKEDLDCFERVAETESQRLQMALDRQAKFLSTLSNLSKKISDTANSITQNLK
jgi:hypothetical protein